MMKTRKLVTMLVASLAVLGAASLAQAQLQPLESGDVSADGRVDTADVVLLARYLARDVAFDARQLLAADFGPWDGTAFAPDGEVNAGDLDTLSRFVAGAYAPAAPVVTAASVDSDLNPATLDFTADAGSLIHVYVNGVWRGSYQLGPSETSASIIAPLDDGDNHVVLRAEGPGGSSLASSSYAFNYPSSEWRTKSPVVLDFTNDDVIVLTTQNGDPAPYQLQGTLTIPAGKTLVLNQGVELAFDAVAPNTGYLAAYGRIVFFEGSTLSMAKHPTGQYVQHGRIYTAATTEFLAYGQPGDPVHLQGVGGGSVCDSWSGFNTIAGTVILDHVDVANTKAIGPVGSARLDFTNSSFSTTCPGLSVVDYGVSSTGTVVGSQLSANVANPTDAIHAINVASDIDLVGNDISGFGTGVSFSNAAAPYVGYNAIHDNNVAMYADGNGASADPAPFIEFNQIYDNDTLMIVQRYNTPGVGPAWASHPFRPTIDARNNWWGSDDFIEIAHGLLDYNQLAVGAATTDSNFPPASGNLPVAEVLFSPFFTDTSMTALDTGCVLGGIVGDEESVPAGEVCYSERGFKVRSGDTFSIGEGATIHFRRFADSEVFIDEGATLSAMGTDAARIVFDGLDPSYSFSGSPNSWGRFESLGPGAELILHYADILDLGSSIAGARAIYFPAGGLLDLFHCDFGASVTGTMVEMGEGMDPASRVESCHFGHVSASGKGVVMTGSSVPILNNHFDDIHTGVQLTRSDMDGFDTSPLIEGNLFESAGYVAIRLDFLAGSTSTSLVQPTIQHNTFIDSTQVDISIAYSRTDDPEIDATENFFARDSSTAPPGEWPSSKSPDEILDSIQQQARTGSYGPLPVDVSRYLAGPWVEGSDPSIDPGYAGPPGEILKSGGIVEFALTAIDSGSPPQPVSADRAHYFDPSQGESMRISFKSLDETNVIVAVFPEFQLDYIDPQHVRWWQALTVPVDQTTEVDWDGTDGQGTPLPPGLYSIMIFRIVSGSPESNISTANRIYDLPVAFMSNDPSALSATTLADGFDPLSGKFPATTVTTTGVNARVGIQITPTSPGVPVSPIWAQPIPVVGGSTGEQTHLVWDGWAPVSGSDYSKFQFRGTTPGEGNYYVASVMEFSTRPNSVFLRGSPPVISRTGGVAPDLALVSDPHHVSRSYEQSSTLSFDVQSSCTSTGPPCQVEAKVFLPGLIDVTAPPLTSLPVVEVSPGSYRATWDWSGYETWNWHESALDVNGDPVDPFHWSQRGTAPYVLPSGRTLDGVFMVRIEVADPTSGYSNSYNAMLTVER